MSKPSAAQVIWMARVLGVHPAAASPAASSTGTLAVWRDAKEVLDERIEALSKAIRDSGDPELTALADQGFFAFGRTESVGLLAALHELEAVDPAGRPAVVQRVRGAARDLATAVTSSSLVQLIDSNPYGVRTDLRGLVLRALQDISTAAR